MSCDILLIYTATHSFLSPDREGQIQTLVIKANENDPPVPKVDGNIQRSRRGLRKATTIHGRWYEGVINTPLIRMNERPQWREYIDSTSEEESHEIQFVDYFGFDSDVSALTIYRPMNTLTFERFGNSDRYKANIKWRQID